MSGDSFKRSKDIIKDDTFDDSSITSAAEKSSGPGNDHFEGMATIRTTAMQVITRFMCRFCGMQFNHRSDMDAHSTLHEDEKPPLACGVCGKTYNTRSKLQRHVRVHSGERPFPCLVCGKRFPRSDHVKQHMKVHFKAHTSQRSQDCFSPQHKKYCRICGVKFEQKEDLQQHLLTHGFSKLFSCTYCGEVFDSSEQLKLHRTSHAHFDESLPVLSIPHPNISLSASGLGSKKKKSGKKKSASSQNKRGKEKPHVALAKFKISHQADSGTWKTIRSDFKKENTTPDSSVPPSDESMPVLENILDKNENDRTKTDDEHFETESDAGYKDIDGEVPQMSISACYSLAEGQDNSDIPEIEEIRASTLTDGSNMVVIPTSSESPDETENVSAHSYTPISEDDMEVTVATSDDNIQNVFVSVSETKPGLNLESKSLSLGKLLNQSSQISSVKPTNCTTVAASMATSTTATMQMEVHPQTTATTNNVSSATTNTTRPTISLLPNVLALRSHPVLTTAMHLHPPTTTSTTSNPINGYSNHFAFARGLRGSSTNSDTFPSHGRKMMRCPHCYIWFEDHALGLLHQSLHSADETDPFTCKKCLKRLGNRLEFTAHIVWHLDPMMEEGGVM